MEASGTTLWIGTGRVARKLIVTIFQTCGGRPVEVPISKRLCHSAAINSHHIPSEVVFNGLTVDVARVKEVTILRGTGENWLDLAIKLCFVVVEKTVPLLTAVWWRAGEEVDGFQNCSVILGVHHKHRCLDLVVDQL